MITYCVRTSIGGKRKCLCSDKACVPGPGPETRSERVDSGVAQGERPLPDWG